MEENKVVWYKDKKLIAGIFLVMLSTAMGFYGKGLLGIFFVKLIAKLYEPFYLLTGLSVYALSFIVLLAGIFLIGMETIKMIKYKIQHHVKRTVRGTYEYTKKFPKKAAHHTRKGYDKIAVTSKKLVQRMK